MKIFKVQLNYNYLTNININTNNTIRDIKNMVNELLSQYNQNPSEYDYDIYLNPFIILDKNICINI
jgi:hypothetical protein